MPGSSSEFQLPAIVQPLAFGHQMNEMPPPESGLSTEMALQRLRADGPNELPRPASQSIFGIAVGVLKEPMFSLLIGAGLVYLALGDVRESVVLLLFATASVSIAVVQEVRTERVLEALRGLSAPRAVVLRDGERKRIAGREVVRDDLIILTEGDRVPADAIVVSATDLAADESLLTGESVPVRKQASAGAPEATTRPGGDDLPYVFSGSLIVHGHGSARVTATGLRSEIGRIGASLASIDPEQPRLTLETRWLVRVFAFAALGFSMLAVLLYGLLRGEWLNSLLGGIALGMSLLPEEFPLVLSAFMAIGAWRLSRIGVLTRRAAAIETLGAATVLCTDKTGTLTENRMAVAELRDATFDPLDAATDPKAKALIGHALAACRPQSPDPMDMAVVSRAANLGIAKGGTRLERDYSLKPPLLVVANVWESKTAGEWSVGAKGAPESIADLCGLPEAARAAMRRATDEMAKAGLRVLGVAYAERVAPPFPASPTDFSFTFAGLVGFADPLRPSVPQAVAECREAGIRPIMITGDYPMTARAIALQAGIAADDVIAGDELERMSDAQLVTRVRSTTVFARIAPHQKLRIVNALKQDGEIVAMTGDGVNDAPSLRAAHIGIAMGSRGTDVAREASSIVLLNDDFASIVRTIRLGRRIYDNLRKAMTYILAVHVPIAGLAILPILLGWPMILMPVHIAFLEMVIDPICAIAFEAEHGERNVMKRPPRQASTKLVSGRLVAWSLLQGGLVLLAVIAVQTLAQISETPEPAARAQAFLALSICNLALILANRSYSASLASALFRANGALWSIMGVTATILALAVTWAPAREIFRFAPLNLAAVTLCLAAGAAVLLVLEAAKHLWRQRLQA